MDKLTFVSSVKKLSTDANGGWVLTLDIPEQETKAMLTMAVLKGKVLRLSVSEDEGDYEWLDQK